MVCNKCGQELPNNSMFCNKCGTKIIVEEVKEVKGDTDNIVDQTNIKRKTHFVMKKIFIFPILGVVLFILYYIGLQFINNNGYELVGSYSYLRDLIPVISFILICPLIIMVIKNIKGIYKNQKKIEPENVVHEEIDQATKIVVKKKLFTPVKVIIITMLIGAIAGGGIIYSNKQKVIKAEKAEVAYMMKLNKGMILISFQAIKIETDAQAISSVWHDAIFNSPVNVNGNKAYTFDDAIKYKNEEFKENGEMDVIVKGRTDIQALMETMINPPTKHKDAYESLMKIYNSYNEFEGMVESPNGSLTGYNQKISTLDSSLSSQLNEFKTRYPIGK
ncbi:zinc ribbon domain-containing protein [Clostridium estertheticum]|uniref:Zinc-ribbon domain-containing protein n=1 Tax=Clostridium estertheticum TaxID=238834 RepID=A0A7Y3SY81_9CLOT|nr:zinc ribbon domain-containing protein [Clostridium estertheticum]NNU77576.1 zinc-ribbon domain-containing protein [Clostridium estertheticum]WBL48481.1 zinc-ribbon domain-containing protein [Clostridium estertheticum]